MSSPGPSFRPGSNSPRPAGLRIRVLFFATLRERMGASALEVELAKPATIADLRGLLVRQNPGLRGLMGTAIFARNREFAFAEDTLCDGDEVGVFPPVSGGSADLPTVVRVTEEAVDLDELVQRIALPTTGAICVFTGLVRSREQEGSPGSTDFLEYEAYSPMAEAKLRQVALEIRSRWPRVEGIALVQRLGRLGAGTPTAVVACSGAHRDSGVFEAARYGIDRLKEIVPIWKKEVGSSGEVWVEGHHQPTRHDLGSSSGPANDVKLMG